MKITKGRLEKIIKEEAKVFFEALTDKEKRELNTKRKREQRRKDDLRFGGEEMRQLSRGIVGEDNYYRDEDGFFSSKKNAKTFSSYFIDGMRKNLKGSTPHPDDSGRGREKDGQGRYKVDGTAKWEGVSQSIGEDGKFSLSLDELSELVDDCLLSFLEKIGRNLTEDKVIEEDDNVDWQSACSRRGFRSFDALLKAMNRIVRSSKGELFDKAN